MKQSGLLAYVVVWTSPMHKPTKLMCKICRLTRSKSVPSHKSRHPVEQLRH